MEKPKVTVVIPVYNTEAFVGDALASIIGQTLHDIDIVVINDGSTDGSVAEVERTAAGDGRVKIYSQPNKGLSEARNAGIDRATGEYIYFMDSDDLLDADAMELCYEKCRAGDLDFVLFDADTFGDPVPDLPWFDYHRTQYFDDVIYDGRDLFARMLQNRSYRASACLSFIRTDFLKEIELRFYPRIIHEDELFTARLYMNASRVGLIRRAFFKRRIRGGSIMSAAFSERNMTGYLTVLSQLHMAAEGQSHDIRRSTRLVTGYILNPMLRNAWRLPLRLRWKLFATAVTRYPREAGLKNLATLLFKRPLKKLMHR